MSDPARQRPAGPGLLGFTRDVDGADDPASGKQAVLILRWFLDNTRLSQLRRDNGIGKSTAYSYLHEDIDVLAAQAPDLHTVLESAKHAGHTHLNIDADWHAAVLAASYAPLLLWGPLLGMVTVAYWRRRHCAPATQP